MVLKQPIKTIIEAEPAPLEIDVAKTAILIVDMQNAFASKGGYFDATGVDISPTERIINPCREMISLGREVGFKIIYLRMVRQQGPADGKDKASPGFHKSRAFALLEKRPDLEDKLYIDGTWGAEIIEDLKPQPGDSVVEKQTYDGFIDTNLDTVLQSFGIRFLIFIGTASNICVETTIRHAFCLDYFPFLVSDAVSPKGSDMMQQATMLNVQSTFGWVTTSEDLLRAMGQIKKETFRK